MKSRNQMLIAATMGLCLTSGFALTNTTWAQSGTGTGSSSSGGAAAGGATGAGNTSDGTSRQTGAANSGGSETGAGSSGGSSSSSTGGTGSAASGNASGAANTSDGTSRATGSPASGGTTSDRNQGQLPNDGTGPSNANRAADGSGTISTGAGTSSTGGMVGNIDDAQTRDLQRGGAGAMNAADAQIAQQLMKIRQSPEQASDQLFVLENAMGNQFEIEFSRLVQEKAQDQQVKQAAQMIQRDHEQAQQRLQTVAQKLNVDLPRSLPSHKQQMLEVFRAMPAEKLQTCYIVDQKAIHAKDITSFADHEKTVQNQDLKSYISEVLPKLKMHGQHIQQLAQTMNVGSNEMAVGGRSSSGRDAGTGPNLSGTGVGGRTPNSGSGTSSGTGTAGAND